MNYLFLGKNNEFFEIISEPSFLPIKIISEDDELILDNEKIINIYFDYHKLNVGCIYPIDYDYILEYYIKNKKKTFNFLYIIAEINKLYASLRYLFEEGDLVFVKDSANYLSRTIHECCINTKAKCMFVDNSFLNKFSRISTKPNVQSKFGNTELFEKFMKSTARNNGLLQSILKSSIFKIDGNEAKKEYDILILGENENSNQFVLAEKEFQSMEEMCNEIVLQNPKSSIAYRPESIDMDIPQINGIDIVYNNSYELFNEIYTISSDLGLFVELLGKNVNWMSNNENKYFNLKENGEKFLAIYMDLCFQNKKLAKYLGKE